MKKWIFMGFKAAKGKRIKDISFMHKPLPFLNLNMIFIY